MDAAAPAMPVMEVSARQASYVDLVCGDVKAQVPGGADNWLQVDGADFVSEEQVTGALHPQVHKPWRAKRTMLFGLDWLA